ncbi:cytochrome C biogenesis protein [Candidatus Saccharibacteria bacterium]|nr:cytochrome C biogenesis protein [Candidatus Saccharibacteria bacterium]
MISFLFVSFLAGVLTAMAPCVLPIIPVVVGGSIVSEEKNRAYIVIGSLFVSIILFTFLLKASTMFLGIPAWVWGLLSGIIVILFGVSLLFPHLWGAVEAKMRFYKKSNQVLGKAYQRRGFWGAVFVGAALGPIFSSCSPVYLLILSVVLPVSFIKGFLYVLAYVFGLCLVLLLVTKFGQRLVKKFNWLEDPNGWFKRGLGILLIIVGLAVILGLDKVLQAWLIENNIYRIDLEQNLIK